MSEIKTEKEFLELLPELAKNDKELIKQYMLTEDIESAEADGWQVTCSSTTKSSMDETMLISIIQDLIKDAKGKDKEALQNLIVMKPTINEDLLEDLIYNKQLDADVVKPAIVESVSYTLRFKKSKRETTSLFEGK